MAAVGLIMLGTLCIVYGLIGLILARIALNEDKTGALVSMILGLLHVGTGVFMLCAATWGDKWVEFSYWPALTIILVGQIASLLMTSRRRSERRNLLISEAMFGVTFTVVLTILLAF